MDIICTKWVSPHWFTAAVRAQLPLGIEMLQVYQIAPGQPSLQSQVRYIEYKVEVETKKSKEDVELGITSLLSVDHLLWQHQRDTGIRCYDLRVLIDDLWLIDWRQGCCTIGMKLRCDSSGSGRPEQVTAALAFTHHPQSIHRTKLILETR
jgi:hypothetical protein